MSESAVDREAVHEEMERARAAFHQLLDHAAEADLRRPTDGTRWTNEQLLFHMLFGYILIRPLLVLLRIFGRLPHGAGRTFADGSFAVLGVNLRFTMVMAGGSIAGALLGGLLLGVFSDLVLIPALAVILLVSAVKLARHE
ncbi:hypothetical protein ACSYGO_43235 [Streptomyces krungchingensis]